MSCSKLKYTFRDKDVQRQIEIIEGAVFKGDKLMQQVKRLKQKFHLWDQHVAQLCVKVAALADEIDSDHKNANIAKLTGSVAGTAATTVAAGAGITLGVGLVLAPATAGLAIPISAAVAAISGTVSLLGAATASGAVIADETLQYCNKKKAQELLEGEKELRALISSEECPRHNLIIQTLSDQSKKRNRLFML